MSAKRKPAEEKPLELAIAVEGKIISSNFEAYKEYAEAQILAISFDLKTDEDFDRADKDAKGLKVFETRLSQAKADFLKQLDEINGLMESVDGLGDLARKSRLELEKRVKSRKEEVREGIVRDGIAALEVRNREFSDIIGASIKNMSSLAKMQEAVTKTVDQINARIEANRDTFAKGKDEHGDAVAFGEDAFVSLTVEAAKVEMERRIERHRAALKEAELKAERDRLQREADEKARQERLAEQARQETARVAAQAAEDAKTISTPPEQTREAVATVEPPAAEPERAASRPAALSQEETAAMREENEAEEMETFTRILKAAFVPVKEARTALVHRANIAKAEAFAVSLGAAWKTLNEGEAQ